MTYERNLKIGVDGYTNDELVLFVYGSSNFKGNVSIIGITTIAGILTASEIYGTFKGNVDSGVVVDKSNYSKVSGIATYANNSGISTYSITSGIATYANNSGISTYSITSGVSTVSQGLTGIPNIVVGIVTATKLYGSVESSQLTGSLPAIDGSALLNVVSTGVGVGVRVNGIPVGTASAINFADALFTNFSAGVATVTAFKGYWVENSVGIHTLSNVGVGTTNPTSRLTVTGNAFITGIVTATDFNSASDSKLKENIRNIENPIDFVMQLKGVNFNWKQSGKKSMGVIADQVQEILPELVTDGDLKTVNYNGLIGLLIEAIKDQQIQINELKNELNK